MEPGICVRQNRGEIIANLVKETGKQRKNLCVYFKTYWKHDKAKNAFLLSYKNCGAPDKERCAGEQKRGRPRKYSDSIGVNVDDEMKAIFESAIKKYYHTRKEDTFRYAYEMMIRDRFTRFKVQPDGKTKYEQIAVYRRKYGRNIKPVIDFENYISTLSRKPRAFLNSPYFPTLSEQVQKYLKSCAYADLKKILLTLVPIIREGIIGDAAAVLELSGIRSVDDFTIAYRALTEDTRTLELVITPTTPM